jgi:hypothetical protein
VEVKGNITGVPGGLYGPGNLTSTDTGLHPHRARITAKASGTNRYAHEQVNEGDYPAFAGTLAESFGVEGSSDAVGYPAYELNGRTDVPVGAFVTLTPAGDLTYLTFIYDGPGDGTEVDAGTCGGGCGTFLGVLDTWCFKLSVVCNTGEFDDATFAQDQDGAPLSEAWLRQTSTGTWTLQYWNPDGAPAAWTNWPFDWSGGSGTVTLTFDTTAGPHDGTPVLTIDGKTLLTRCVGSDATFSGGQRNGFTGTAAEPTTPCDPNDFTLRVTCDCCPIDGWQGDGWYCVEDTGPTDCYAIELLEAADDHCDGADPFVICSGPYASQALAEVDCPPPETVQTDCCVDPVEEVLNWAITNKVGVCSCAPDSGTVTYNGTDSWDSVQFACPILECEENAEYSLWCVDGDWFYGLTGVGGSLAAASATCPEDGPFEVVFNVTPSGGGSYTITFTAP